ncbi:hypothetical protein DPMN_056310 [Dreissena polymorpha]|uniref:TIR domain-containing protein n=1 Tax=Dreissena polymorpha TaxID=45954 RepID=A0A9D4CTE4_DREPO|nr:hypothetical protein DPMN_056310 [Dreissena polymorpha]
MIIIKNEITFLSKCYIIITDCKIITFRFIISGSNGYEPEDDNPSIHFTYDAFVCHIQDDPEDKRFVQDLIEELEDRRGLRLYVPGRDNRLDASENIIHADEIEESCRRVIIVLSRSFFQTRLSVFQERFAQELWTAERRARMIAIIRERGAVVPDTLNDCNTLDYNDMNEINWALLASSINEPITQATYRRFILNRNGRGLSFPFPAGGNENTVLTLRNSQPPPGPNRSPDPVSTEHTRTQWPDGESGNTTPKTVHSDHTTPTFILPTTEKKL